MGPVLSPSWRLVVPWVTAALTVGLCAAVLTLDRSTSYDTGPALVFVPVILVAMCSGLVLAVKRPENLIGLLLMANGLTIAAAGTARNYAIHGLVEAPGSLPGARLALLYDDCAWPLLFAPLAAVAYVFPTGRLAEGRARRLAQVGMVALVLLLVCAAFTRDRFEPPFEAIDSPLPAVGALKLGLLVGIVGALAALAGAALSVRDRVRVATGIERRQIRLVAHAAVLVPVMLLVTVVEALVSGRVRHSGDIAVVTMGSAVPVSIAVSVLRYRLYDIGRLVNRTLVYVLLSAALVGIYASVSLAVGLIAGSGSTVPTAAATLAAALGFGALRSRAQALVDRRFSRARYDGLRQVEAHLEGVRAGTAAPETTGDVLAQALGDPTLQLRYWIPDAAVHVDSEGREVTGEPGPGRDATPVRRGDLKLGVVIHDPRLSDSQGDLDSIVTAAGLAIEIARLQAEVARRLREVEASRAQLVTATYEERRRLERDLHDGTQQRLVAVGLALRNLQSGLPDEQARGRLDLTVDELTTAIDELRELARGVRPAVLDAGLAAALRDLAARSPLQLEVTVTPDRFDERIEAAAYFVASEALANTAKHARASCASVSARHTAGRLVIRVRDDGVGGAQPGERSGLAGLGDRVAALGGQLRIDSPLGRGTTVTAELPCGS